MKKEQHGYLLIAVIIIIVVIGFIGLAVFHMVTLRSHSESHRLAAKQAFYAAEAGIEQSLLNLKAQPDTTAVETYCNGGWSDDVVLQGAEYKHRCSTYNIVAARLAATVLPNATVLPVDSTVGYAAIGRIKIDAETISYSSVSSNSGDCSGYSHCFLVVKPITVEHAANSVVSQNQFLVEAQGVVPDFDVGAPQGFREVVKALAITFGGGFENLWAVGDEGGIYRKQGTGGAWEKVTSDPTGLAMNSVGCASPDKCFIVGKSGVIYNWDGTSWSKDSQTLANDLTDVACSSSNRCWIFDDAGNIYGKTGDNNWTVATTYADPLEDMSCPSSSLCIAVGKAGHIKKWNGSSWSSVNYNGTPNTESLWAVSCPSTSVCWAVGDGGVIIKIDPAAGNAQYEWDKDNNQVDGEKLVTVSCGGDDKCWAFSENKQDVAEYTAGVWQGINPAWQGGVPNVKLTEVHCINPTLCYLSMYGETNKTLIAVWDAGVDNKWRRDPVNISGNKQGEHLLGIGSDNPSPGAHIFVLGWKELVK